jgi:type IV secretion system protein TrbG
MSPRFLLGAVLIAAGCASDIRCADGSKTKAPSSADVPVEVSREAPLPPNTAQALALSDAALSADPQAKGADGRVIFTYGSAIPTIVCALMHVTEIDMEPGETIAKDGIDIGESTEVLVSPRHAGSGRDAYDYLVIKPKSGALNTETTMTVGTDKRVYYFRLRTTDGKFLARIAFAYPDEVARAKRVQEETVAAAKLRAALPAPTPPPVKPWHYAIKKKGQDANFFVPQSVGDDGAHTYIEFSQDVRAHGLPVLEIRGPSGPIAANSHWETNTLIVDALFADGCLLEGVGRKQQRVCIHNETPGKKFGGEPHGGD